MRRLFESSGAGQLGAEQELPTALLHHRGLGGCARPGANETLSWRARTSSPRGRRVQFTWNKAHPARAPVTTVAREYSLGRLSSASSQWRGMPRHRPLFCLRRQRPACQADTGDADFEAACAATLSRPEIEMHWQCTSLNCLKAMTSVHSRLSMVYRYEYRTGCLSQPNRRSYSDSVGLETKQWSRFVRQLRTVRHRSQFRLRDLETDRQTDR